MFTPFVVFSSSYQLAFVLCTVQCVSPLFRLAEQAKKRRCQLYHNDDDRYRKIVSAIVARKGWKVHRVQSRGLGVFLFCAFSAKEPPVCGGKEACYSGTTDAHSIMTAPHVPYKFMCDIKRRSHAFKHSTTAISTRNGRKCTDSLCFFLVHRQIPKREAVKVCNYPFLCSVRLKVDSVNALTQD